MGVEKPYSLIPVLSVAILIEPSDYLPSEGEGQTNFQEQADLYQQRSFENASRNLANRANNPAEVSENYEAEAQLLDVQNQLSQAADRGDHVTVLRLEALANQLASALVSGTEVSPTPQPEAPTALNAQDYATQRAEEDPALVEALNNASEMLDNDVITQVNDLLGSDDVEVVAHAADVVKQITPNMIASSDVVGTDELAPSAMSYFTEVAGEEVANDINVLVSALATGRITKSQAIKTAMQSPKHMNAMIAAAADPSIPFQLSL